MIMIYDLRTAFAYDEDYDEHSRIDVSDVEEDTGDD